MDERKAKNIALRELRKDYLLAIMEWEAFGGTKAAALAPWKELIKERVAELLAQE